MTVFRIALLVVSLLLTASLVPAAQVRVGDSAPDFGLLDAQGRPHTLAEFRGFVVAVDFWAMWCPVCRRALPALDSLARRHGEAGLRVLAINIDSSRRAADTFLAEQLPTTPMTVLFDSSGGVMARFGAQGMPALFVIDRDGVVQLVEVGYASDAIGVLEDRIVAILGPPSVPTSISHGPLPPP